MTHLSRQEAFAKAYKGLESQGFESAIKNGHGIFLCSYRGDEGRRCAFGWLIPDHLEEKIEEGIGVDAYDDDFFHDCGLNPEDKEFFKDLQFCHDSAYLNGKDPCNLKSTSEYMKEELIYFAQKYDLEIPE